jgi:spermidine synthase
MNELNRIEPARLAATGRFLPLLLLLFAGTGCSALIYEIVWFQLLQFVIGSSAVSLGVLLGTFMGGMCLGSIALPRLVSPKAHPLRVYALLELGLAMLGIALQFGLPLADYIYTGGDGFTSMLLRAGVCVICLLPPTMLMGATLPAIARWVETTPQGVSWLGLFYGGNIAGAVIGCLLAGFYLLREYDIATATYVAVWINLSVVLTALALSAPASIIFWMPAIAAGIYDGLVISHACLPENVRFFSFGAAAAVAVWVHVILIVIALFQVVWTPADYQPPVHGKQSSGERAPGVWAVYVTIALSGACALAAEVVWTRLLSLMLGATVYTFSIILAVFLIGLGIGSSFGAYLARTRPRPRLLLGVCQLLLAAAIAWTAHTLGRSMPYWPIRPDLSQSPWFTFQLDLARCLWAILPAASLWGASFPLALASAAKPGQDPGRLAGGIYAANTVGAIVGAVGASLLLIGWLGTAHTQRVLIAVSAVGAIFVLSSYAWEVIKRGPEAGPELASVFMLVAFVAASAIPLAWSVPDVPWKLVAFGRNLPRYEGEWWKTKEDEWTQLYLGEGMNSSVAVTRTSYGVRNFHVSGKVEASSDPADMRLQRMLGHIPALFHPRPQSVLIVGCGAGVTAGSFVLYPEITRIVICEIEPLVPREVAGYFEKENYGVVDGVAEENPRTIKRKDMDDLTVEVVYDDARHYILTTSEKFDIITSDPIHPWVKGSAALYTKEYFELCKRHLNPGGLVTQWVPLYESSEAVVQSELATFFDVFPHGTIWHNDRSGEGYDTVLLGQTEPLAIDVNELQARIRDHPAVKQSLEDVKFHSALGLLMTYAGQASDLCPWLKNAEINRDRNLRLQYLAGMELNQQKGDSIYKQMLKYRQFPESLFTGGLNDLLRSAIDQKSRQQ